MAIALFLSLPITSAYFHLPPPLCCNPWFFSDMTFFCWTTELWRFFFFLSFPNIINFLIYLSLPNLYFYTIRSMKIFLKVLNKVNFRAVAKPKLFLFNDLLPFTKILELLAINQSLSERIIFVPFGCWSSYMFWLFYNLHGCVRLRSWVG